MVEQLTPKPNEQQQRRNFFGKFKIRLGAIETKKTLPTPQEVTIFEAPKKEIEPKKTIKKFTGFLLDIAEQIDYIPEKPSRVQKIKNKIKEKFFHRKQPITKGIVDGLSVIGAPDIDVKGKENIQKAIELSSGKNLIFILNHLSNFDTAAFERSLRYSGFGKLTEKLIFLQGIKLDKNPFTKVLTTAFNRIKVWPPTLTPKTDAEKNIASKMTKESFINVKKALEEGYSLAIYAEGGRSYNGKLKKMEPSIVSFLKINPDTIVLPVAISGTNKVMPPKSPLILPLEQVHVSFAEPIIIRELTEACKDLPSKEEKQVIADIIMGKIAEELPYEQRGELFT